MKFYGLGDEQVLRMPIRRFWLLHRSIDRLQAEQDLRLLAISVGAQSAEGYKSTSERLRAEQGKVVVYDEVQRAFSKPRDVAGLMALKSMQ